MANVLHSSAPPGDQAYGIRDLGSAYTDLWIGFDVYVLAFAPVGFTGNYAVFGSAGFDLDAIFAEQDLTADYQAGVYYADNGPFQALTLGQWYHIDVRSQPAMVPLVEELWVDGVDQGVVCTTSLAGEDYPQAFFGLQYPFGGGGDETYMRNLEVGTTKGASDVWSADLSLSVAALFSSTVVTGAGVLETISDPTGGPVVTEAPTGVTSTTAVLQGSVNPEGVSSTAFFEYGLTIAYGETTAAQAIGSGTDPVDVEQFVTGLRPGRTYHVRAVRNP